MYLLLQALVMIAAQLLLLEVCVRFMPKSIHYQRVQLNAKAAASYAKYVGQGLQQPRLFWAWDSFAPYLLTLLVFVGMLLVLQATLGWSVVYVEIVGYVALTAESMLGFPQVLKNVQRGDTSGLRYKLQLSLQQVITHLTVGIRPELIMTWLIGDSFKTFYFGYSAAPLQFIVCGCIQLIVDLVLVFQMWKASKRGKS
jgi:hypothetical protein